jgi:hypothetical protein
MGAVVVGGDPRRARHGGPDGPKRVPVIRSIRSRAGCTTWRVCHGSAALAHMSKSTRRRVSATAIAPTILPMYGSRATGPHWGRGRLGQQAERRRSLRRTGSLLAAPAPRVPPTRDELLRLTPEELRTPGPPALRPTPGPSPGRAPRSARHPSIRPRTGSTPLLLAARRPHLHGALPQVGLLLRARGGPGQDPGPGAGSRRLRRPPDRDRPGGGPGVRHVGDRAPPAVRRRPLHRPRRDDPDRDRRRRRPRLERRPLRPRRRGDPPRGARGGRDRPRPVHGRQVHQTAPTSGPPRAPAPGAPA